ncbi:hypothetical protein HUU42_12835, partial [bacterium]|nr:hypothetical protein [bacterium]
MKRLLLLVLFIPCALSAQTGQSSKNLAEALTAHLLHLEADPNQVASIANFSFTRDAGTFNLKNGKIYLTKPFHDKVVAAIFIGEGTFSMTPPTQIEREHLARFYKTQSLEKKFTSLFLIFNDSTLTEFQLKNTFSIAEISSEVNDLLKAHCRYIADKDYECLSDDNSEILNALLNLKHSPLFYASITDRTSGSLSGSISPLSATSWSSDPLFFEINPYDVENVTLMRRNANGKFQFSKEIISMFSEKSYSSLPIYLRSQHKDMFRVNRYTANCRLGKDIELDAVTEIEVEPYKSETEWLYFYLFYKLKVDSVLFNGQRASFYKPYESSEIWEDSYERTSCWIQSDDLFKSGSKSIIKIFYKGEIIERIDNDFLIRASTSWLPLAYTTYPTTKMYDITFIYPSHYKLACTGSKKSENTNKGWTTSQWVTKNPLPSFSFNIGFFRSYKIKNERIPEIEINMSEADHLEIGAELVKEGIGTGKDMEKQVGADIANSYSFFQDMLGPNMVDKLYVTETFGQYGVSFWGLINLHWSTFQRTDESGDDELLRSHEVAHQWWGYGVTHRTYHDRWLSEAFAEYFGLWYTQIALNDNKKFFKFLNDYREHIVENRNSLFEKLIGADQEAGPIWLGTRTRTSTTEGDDDLLIYEKGAWVLHMLRNLMLDLNTMNDDRFKKMMRDFYQTYAGQTAATEDFKLVTDKHFGSDMSWFFDQWIYGSDIPKYIFSYRVIPTKEGKFKVYCRAEQKN